MNSVVNDVPIAKTANLLSAMLEGCFRRTEASSLKMTNQRYDSIYKEVDTNFCDFVKVRLSADEELRSKKLEFSIVEVIIKVVCCDINPGELDTCYNIWRQFRDEKLLEFDRHFTNLRDLEVNISNDMLVYFWNEYAIAKCLGHDYNIWWVITAREDDGYLIFKDVFPHDLKAEMAALSRKHAVKLPKTNKNMNQTVEGFTHKNKGERIMKEYGNKGAFGMNIPAPNSYGWDGDPGWAMLPLADGKLRIAKILPDGTSLSLVISVDVSKSTLNIEKHNFSNVTISSDKDMDRKNNISKSTIQTSPTSTPINFKGNVQDYKELQDKTDMFVGDYYLIKPTRPDLVKFYDTKPPLPELIGMGTSATGNDCLAVVWTGTIWEEIDVLDICPYRKESMFLGFFKSMEDIKVEYCKVGTTALIVGESGKEYHPLIYTISGWSAWDWHNS